MQWMKKERISKEMEATSKGNSVRDAPRQNATNWCVMKVPFPPPSLSVTYLRCNVQIAILISAKEEKRQRSVHG